ncbi:MAG: hypothetical protein Q9191_002831 [Dirinaria sp. TL-2023a]
MDGLSYTTLPDSDQATHAEVPVNSELDKTVIDRQGLDPHNQRRQNMMFESPSRRKHTFTMHNLRVILGKMMNDYGATAPITVRTRETYNLYKTFFDNSRHTLGAVWASSGFNQRTVENGRLDWALIELTNRARQGKNLIPPKEEWADQDHAEIAGTAGQLLRGVGSCENPADRSMVLKKGSRTGLTSGEFSLVKHTVKWLTHDNRLLMPESSEYAFVSSIPSRGFGAGGGDSGSFVFSPNNRKFVGLLWGGLVLEIPSTNSLVYVTDAKALLQDMNDRYRDRYSFELAED